MLATGVAQFVQVACHFPVVIDRAAFQPGLLDQPAKSLILHLESPDLGGLARPIDPIGLGQAAALDPLIQGRL